MHIPLRRSGMGSHPAALIIFVSVLETSALVYRSSNAVWSGNIMQPALDTTRFSSTNTGNLSHRFSAEDIEAFKNRTVLFYHVHFPKTGGTSVSNLIVSDLCGKSTKFLKAAGSTHGTNLISTYGFDKKCSLTCEAALVDTELACINRNRFEHLKWDLLTWRAVNLMRATHSQKVIWITSLRSGTERIISQWAHEVYFGSWIPPPSVPKISNESLLLYITGGKHHGEGWISKNSISQRNNIQVAELAAIQGTDPVEPVHLEIAKTVLSTGEWVIGFTDCLSQMHERLLSIGQSIGALKGPVPDSERDVIPRVESRRPSTLIFNKRVLAELETQCWFDNELYAWALERSDHDPRRFVGGCASPRPRTTLGAFQVSADTHVAHDTDDTDDVD